MAQSDEALISKMGSGKSLTKNEQARFNKLASEGSQRGRNIRAWQNGDRDSPS